MGVSDPISKAEAGPASASPSSAGPSLIIPVSWGALPEASPSSWTLPRSDQTGSRAPGNRLPNHSAGESPSSLRDRKSRGSQSWLHVRKNRPFLSPLESNSGSLQWDPEISVVVFFNTVLRWFSLGTV